MMTCEEVDLQLHTILTQSRYGCFGEETKPLGSARNRTKISPSFSRSPADFLRHISVHE